MSEGNSTEIAVGGLVLATAIGFMVYAAQAVGIGGVGDSYELRASFRSVDGIRVGTDVRMAGVTVGEVTAVEFNPATYMADTRFTMRQGVELPDDSIALISSEGLLGGNFLEVTPGGSPFNLEPGAEINDTQGSVSLTGLLMKFVGGAADDVLKGDE